MSVALDGYTFSLLHEDGVLATLRGRHPDAAATILMASAASDAVAAEAAQYLNNEFSLRERLGAGWARKPYALVWRPRGMALLYQDGCGEPLVQRAAAAADIDSFLSLAISMSAALGAAHKAGIVHRNIKPANILVDSAGTCRLGGFGLASTGAPDTGSVRPVRGTPAYMSPEHTGRTALAVDARSDLYSLGVVLFQLLTGRLPFSVADPGEASAWIHAHLASAPAAPHQLAPDSPFMLSLLVLKLLAKNPQERYQSAAGLEADLKRCRLAWQATATIPLFQLALHDRASRLAFPARLYGRDASVAALVAAYARVRAEGTLGLALIQGASGIGKSALLTELLADSLLQGAAVATAKVDQYGGAAPYAALGSAFRRLVLCILGQSGQVVDQWRKWLAQGLSDPALALSLVPELGLLIGRPPPAGASGGATENRLLMAVLGLLRVFAAPGRPLVLIVDDVQWLDAATIHLLENLIGLAAGLPILLVLTCRAGEPGGEHPLTRTLALLAARAAHVHEVSLAALDAGALEQLLADTLASSPSQVAGLADLIHQKTAGNPYFVRQFVTTMVDEGLAVRSDGGAWTFHLDQIRARSYTDNVADLVVRRLGGLPARVRQVLKALACLGRGGSADMLCRLFGMDVNELGDVLGPALEADVLALEPAGYVFTHDRLQEAAYAAMGADERQQLHFAAGVLLAADAAGSSRDDLLFTAVDHLAQATSLIAADARLRYAGLARLAAERARHACAYQSALGYLAMAHGLLAVGPPSAQADALALEATTEQARCEFHSGRLDAAFSLVQRVLAAPAGRLARGQVQRLAADIHLRRGDYQAAVATALDALRPFGIAMPADPSDQACAEAWAALRQRLQGDWRGMLHGLPQLEDPEVAVAMALLAGLLVPASFTSPRLHFLQLCHTLQLTLQYGMAPESTVALAWFGVLACHRHRAYADGFAYGQAARALVDQHGYAANEAQVLLALDQLSVWTQPLAFSLDCAQAGFDAACAKGDLTMACFEACHRTCMLLVRGDALAGVADEIARALAFVARVGFKDVEAILQVQQHFADHLRQLPAAGAARADVLSPSHSFLAGAASEPMATLRFWRWLYIAIIDYLEDDFASAAACLAQAGALAWSAPGHIHLLDYHLFSVLALCQGAPGPARLAEARAHAGQIAEWAAANPVTFADKHALAQGALCELDGDAFGALGYYEQAAAHAHRQGFAQYAAIAHQLAAALAGRSGHATAAQAHLKAACAHYRRWGALRLVAGLERQFPQARSGAGGAGQGTVTIIETAEIRDIGSVIRSARALSEEIQVEALVQALMRIALEHASAQRGLLIRMHGEAPMIEACALLTEGGIEVGIAPAAPGEKDLPLSMLYTVMRTGQPVNVSDSQRPAPYAGDPYLLRYRRCAAICIPMLKQAQLIGMLYLENRLAPAAFTSEHTKVLSLLAAQAAVSLETAQLYAELLEENQQRRRVERALRESKATLLLGERINQSGSWTWDLERGVLDCSAEFCRIFGFDPALPAIAFGSVIERIHPDDRERVLQLVKRCTANRAPIEVEYRIAGADGSVRYISGVGKPMGEYDCEMYVGTVSDITLRRAAEDSLRQAQAELARVARVTTVGQLTASIAHEVNQPLMSISSNAGASLRWMERDPPRLDQVRQGLLDIALQSQRAGGIIQTLQALTRKAPPALAPVDLHGTIQRILSISRAELERQDIALKLALTASGWTLGDAVQLQQLMLNIVVNAVEAMSEVEGRARVLTIASCSTAEGQIVVRVDDTGVGLSAASAEHIFEPFCTSKPHGMGMGLAICRSIIDAHHGSVRAQPLAPHGCSIVFALPEHPVDVAARDGH